ncbi:hypothetical protein ACOBQX_11760 [Actinokineospora sp. G85]|uniref:hypothetical protein n=1 Tax=Actinokineospora sp. G85 TaxID=3406626 RepID=UPI003C73464D
MEQHHGGLDGGGLGGVDTSILPLVLRLLLLLTGAVVAGIGLLRPQSATLPTRLLGTASAAAGLSAALALVSIAVADVHWAGALAHVALVALVPALLRSPQAARWAGAALGLLLVVETTAGRSGVDFALDTVYVAASVAWFGYAALTWLVPADQRRLPRADQHVVTLGAALVVAGALRLVASGLAFDRRVVGTALGLVLLAALVLPLLVLVLARRTALRWGVLGVAAGFVAWTALAAVPAPPALPTPGVPVLVDAAVADSIVPTLVIPHRPGPNLVHFPASAGEGIEVSVGDGDQVAAFPRKGAEGTWAVVDLPAGRSELTVHRAGETDGVWLDAGTERVGPRATGEDGAECASAALGGLVAGRRDVLAACPDAGLSTQDEAALRKLVAFLRDRGAPALTLKSDTSPRGVRAGRVVREAAGAAGLRVADGVEAENALVLVGGWESGARELERARSQQSENPVYQYGLYVAPWLLTNTHAGSVTSVNTPLRFDPRETQPATYALELANAFGGERPSLGGLHAWLGDRRGDVDGEPRVFAVAQVNVMQMGPDEQHAPGMSMIEARPGQWVAKATIVPVSGVLLD